jgi:hypothetical protein
MLVPLKLNAVRAGWIFHQNLAAAWPIEQAKPVNFGGQQINRRNRRTI